MRAGKRQFLREWRPCNPSDPSSSDPRDLYRIYGPGGARCCHTDTRFGGDCRWVKAGRSVEKGTTGHVAMSVQEPYGAVVRPAYACAPDANDGRKRQVI
jgi:hypothetical protein